MGNSIERAAALLRRARRVVALTGAGVSAESGVPTFRGKNGLWNNYRAEELATPEAFARNPALVWRWYNWRRGLIRSAAPNGAHLSLAAFERAPFEFTLITQNVDGLHSLAGSRNLLELHGNLWRIRCDSCGRVEHNETVLMPEPPCCDCGASLRPDVVWFGEPLDPQVFGAAVEGASRADAMLIVGTSCAVYPAASLAAHARRFGAAIIEINLAPTPVTPWAQESLAGRAGEILPLVAKRIL